ncbi:hypothetical protein AAFG07_42125 [Bradyrhizobium sp. B097]|uniref:hypothetical protein n=1 Tax=Bradyrhizobium sp. B097 TaxID=3140244 RepID=UPI0031838839
MNSSAFGHARPALDVAGNAQARSRLTTQNHEMLSGTITRKGSCMKTLLFAAVAATLLAQGAFAAEPACHKIEGTVGRLACYDAAFPPTVKKPPAIDSNAPRSEYKDPLIAEEARLAAKLKNICRGC